MMLLSTVGGGSMDPSFAGAIFEIQPGEFYVQSQIKTNTYHTTLSSVHIQLNRV